MFACALMGWLVYTQPTAAGSDKAQTVHRAAQPDQPETGASQFSAVAEEKREEAILGQCEKKAAAKQLGHDDRQAFIERCLLTSDSSAEPTQPATAGAN